MEEKKDFTMMFKKEIKQVVKALEEKKYNVVDQLTGYLLSGDPTYITSHNNARNIITNYEREDLLEEIVKSYLKKK